MVLFHSWKEVPAADPYQSRTLGGNVQGGSLGTVKRADSNLSCEQHVGRCSLQSSNDPFEVLGCSRSPVTLEGDTTSQGVEAVVLLARHSACDQCSAGVTGERCRLRKLGGDKELCRDK